MREDNESSDLTHSLDTERHTQILTERHRQTDTQTLTNRHTDTQRDTDRHTHTTSVYMKDPT